VACRSIRAADQHAVPVGKSIPLPIWTCPLVGYSIPAQKWNSPQEEQVHYTDAAVVASK